MDFVGRYPFSSRCIEYTKFWHGHLILFSGFWVFHIEFPSFDTCGSISHWVRTGPFHHRMLREELGWNQQKSDELLLPVIQRVNKRSAAAAANKQSSLDAYFGDSVGSVGGSAVPRKRQAYTSKRLQKVVTDYREEQRKRSRTTARSVSAILNSDRSGDDRIGEADENEDLAGLGEGLEVDGSDNHGEDDPISGSITGIGKTSKETTTAKTAAPTKRRPANEKRKVRKSSKNTTSSAPRSTKRKKRTRDSDDYDDDERVDADEATPVPARPRPKPVRKKANTNPGAGSEHKTTDQERDG